MNLGSLSLPSVSNQCVEQNAIDTNKMATNVNESAHLIVFESLGILETIVFFKQDAVTPV